MAVGGPVAASAASCGAAGPGWAVREALAGRAALGQADSGRVCNC